MSSWVVLFVVTLLGSSVASLILARKRGYDGDLFAIGGLMAGPLAIWAALTADRYAVEEEPELQADPAASAVTPQSGEGWQRFSAETAQQAPQPVIEAPQPVIEAPQPVQLPEPVIEAPQPVIEAQENPGVKSLVDLITSEAPKSSRYTNSPQQPPAIQAIALGQPIAPGEPTYGICPHCGQESCADWYGLCVHCMEAFPVAIPYIDPTAGKEPVEEDGKPEDKKVKESLIAKLRKPIKIGS